jgi:hypothetical protein
LRDHDGLVKEEPSDTHSAIKAQGELQPEEDAMVEFADGVEHLETASDSRYSLAVRCAPR